MLRENLGADRLINVSSVFQSNSYVEKGLRDHGQSGCETLFGGTMIKDKGMLKGERRINSPYELRSQGVWIALSREFSPRERGRWNRDDESCKLTI